ncbi:MAG: ABC transporter ATP-binding protein [Acidobacteriota bacterium]|nr:ABC transporter ATP-binding protein [Acidobacteriota bacterium]
MTEKYGWSTVLEIYGLLNTGERRRIIVLFSLMVVGMGLEMLGVGLVIPAVTLLLQADLSETYPPLAAMLEVLGQPTQVQLIAGGMLLLVCVYLVKALFLGFLAWYQNDFAFGVQRHISSELFATYLYQPYAFHLQRNSAQLIRNAVNEVHKLWFLILNPTLVVLGEGLVLIGVTCLLFIVEPVGALIVVLVLGCAAWGFHLYTRGRLLRLGIARQHHDGQRIQELQQGLGGVKEAKLLGRESGFLAKYEEHNAESARIEQFQATLQLLPRLWIELLAVTGLATLIITMLAQGQQAATIVPTLGLFAAAAFRLMPSAYRVLGAVQNLPYGMPVIKILREELKLTPELPINVEATFDSRVSNSFKNDIELVNVDYMYPSSSEPALTGLNISIRKGELIGFVGPSGSGKSTLVDIVLGLLTPTSGEVQVDKENIQADLRSWQDQIGYVPQSVYLTDDTLRNNVAFGIPPVRIDEGALNRAIQAAQLDTFVVSQPDGLDTVVGERGVRLSGGQLQRIGIARALYHDPSVLVLDEATSALDTLTEKGVMNSVEALQGSKTLLIVAHRLSTVKHCSRLYQLDRGRVIAEGTPARLLREQKAV